MRTLELTPLYRSTAGYHPLGSLLDSVPRWDRSQPDYPPHNLQQLEENRYRITVAVAGFTQEELDIEVENRTLRVSGRKLPEQESGTFLHREIAVRNFQRHFRLADHVRVNSARLNNGLLQIDLDKELPESLKPRSIDIQSAAAPGLFDVESDQEMAASGPMKYPG